MPSRSSKPRRSPVSTDKRFRKKSPSTDFGPIERWQHSGRKLEPTEHAGVMVTRATESNVIDMLVTRRMVTGRQNEAALRLKGDYHRAKLAPHMTGSYTGGGSGRDPFRTHERDDTEEAAYQRWSKAIAHLGAGLSGVVISTVCMDQTPAPVRVARLQIALEKLADWYGLREG